MPYLEDMLVRREFSVRWKSPVRSEVEEYDMSLTELAELYERAAYPTGQDDVTSRPQFTKASAGTLEITDGTSASSGTSRKDSQVCAKGKIMMYLFFWIVMEFALVIGAVQLILKKGGF